MAKKGAVIGVLASMGVLASGVLLATRAKAAPEESEGLWLTNGSIPIIPTSDDILASKNLGELDVYYIYIGLLFLTMKIDKEKYESLYQAYVTRFYELKGASQ